MTVLPSRGIAIPATAGRDRAAPTVLRASRVLPLLDTASALLAGTLAAAGPVGLATHVAVVLVLAWPLAVSATGDYRLPGGLAVRARRVGVAALVLPTPLLLLTAASERPLVPLGAAALSLGAAAVGIGSRACLTAAAERGVLVTGLGPFHRVVAVGSSSSVTSLLGHLAHAGTGRFRVLGTCVADGGTCGAGPGPTTYGLQTCVGLARACDADAVLVAPDPSLDGAELRRLQWSLDAAGLETLVWTGVPPLPAPGRTSLDLDGLGLLRVGRPRRLAASYTAKRLLDRVVALLALVALAPLLALLALAVRLDSEGPAFYRHTRVGKDDTRFTMWKLRTMTPGAASTRTALVDVNQAAGPLFKIHDDPRVTRLGRWLRRTSLDELPQLLNVALGQMSLVGPRPALPAEVTHYDADVRHRLAVHPGMTGLWQVSGRSDLSWEESVRLDLRYVDDWSLLLDLRILARTVAAVWRGGGAY